VKLTYFAALVLLALPLSAGHRDVRSWVPS